MASIDEIVTELKKLSPEQVNEVAQIVNALSRTEHHETPQPATVIPTRVVDQGVRHGWPAHLFTRLIGSLPDFERAVQPPRENRADL